MKTIVIKGKGNQEFKQAFLGEMQGLTGSGILKN